MRGPRKLAGVLVGVALLVFSGTALADGDDKPGVVTLAASETSSSGALLPANVHPHDSAASYYFRVRHD